MTAGLGDTADGVRKANGTLDHPATHDPQQRQLKKQDLTMNFTLDRPASARDDAGSAQNRNREMQLLPESLARSHMPERRRPALPGRRGPRPAVTRGLQRRAGRATLRARRALAMAVMQ